jgi:L-alanine-DL-glutamate epimerase-like enolase superfamily enzyme
MICIREVRVRAMKPYPLPRPFYDATMGPFNSFPFATIELLDEDGTTGEAPFFAAAITLLESLLLPRLLGRKGTHQELFREWYWAIRNEGFRGHASAMLGQLDLALYDLAARRAGKPLHRYLGSTRDWAHVYGSGGGTNLTEEELIEEMTGFVRSGFRVLKMKIGRNFGSEPQRDLERVKLVRQAIGNDIALAIDANQTWPVKQALEVAHQMAPLNIAWFEEPVHSAALHEIEAFCAQTPIPASFGESERSGKVFPALIAAGVKHLQPIPGYLTGIGEYLEVMEMAERMGLAFSSGGYSQAHAQLVAVAGESAHTELLIPVIGPLDAYLSLKPLLKDGRYHLPPEPGLCFRVDWEGIKRSGQLLLDKVWKSNLQ